MSSATPGSVKSIYAHLDCLVEGLDQLKSAGFKPKEMVVTSPLPRPEIEEALYEGKPSPVRWFTMCGAILGGLSGFSTASLTHLNWPMIIPAGKPLVSIPAFIVNTFEATILTGCFFTLLGMIFFCGLPARRLQIEVTDPRLSDDMFALVLNGLTAERASKAREILNSTGAIEVSGLEASND